jgi:protein arginine kinase activator
VNCEACGQSEAVVHLTNIVGGRMEKLRLCAPCAAAKGFIVEPDGAALGAPLPGQVNEILGKVMEALEAGLNDVVPGEDEPAACPACGATLADFRKKGRLGCPHDYVAFEDELEKLLRRINGKSVHVGTLPAKAKERQGRRRFVKERIEALKRELDAAVRAENFEEAASLRDRLRDLERAEEQTP